MYILHVMHLPVTILGSAVPLDCGSALLLDLHTFLITMMVECRSLPWQWVSLDILDE